MYATLSAENRISTRMKTLDVSANFVAALTGVPATRLHRALVGTRPLENGDGLKVLNVLDELLALAEACKPIPVSFRNAAVIRELLKAKRRGDFFVAVGLLESKPGDGVESAEVATQQQNF